MKSLVPPIALDKHIGVLGATGSGKTSAAKAGIVEPALEAGERVIILDPTAAWWGLRLGADGKKKGYPIYIFGGDHSDYPLRARDAETLASAFGTSSDSAIVDMSHMTVSDRMTFFTEFAEVIRRKNRGPLKLIIDEAHLFMPQAGAGAGGQVPAMLHAGNNLVALGRSKGLRITLISQRPAKLHKDSLTQVQSLIVMRLLAPQDRKAISAWIADQADTSREGDIVASLPSLKPGEAWIWSPQDEILDRVKFALPKTFDSSRAPDYGDGEGPQLAPLDMEALKVRLGKIAENKAANDPDALRAIIRRQNSTIDELTNRPPSAAAPDEAEISRIKSVTYAAGIHSGRAHIRNMFSDIRRDIIARLTAEEEEMTRLVDKAAGEGAVYQTPTHVPKFADLRKEAHAAENGQPTIAEMASLRSRAAAPPSRPQYGFERQPGSGPSSLPKGEQIIMAAIASAQFGMTRQHLTVQTGYKRSTRDAYIQRLREKGFADQNGENIVATPEGIAALGSGYEPPKSGDSLREHVLRTLPDGERRILDILITAYPKRLSRDEIGDRTGFKRSTRDAYLQRLSTRELVSISHGEAIPSAHLFD